MFEIWFVALSSGPLPSLFKIYEGPRIQDGPGPEGSQVQTIEMHRNISKNLLLQNHLAQMLEIWYVALPSGPLLSSFKRRSEIPKWPRPEGP